MSEENKENRINVDDLPQAEQELSPEEAKDLKGGLESGSGAVLNVSGTNTWDTSTQNKDGIIVGTGLGGGPHVK